MEEWRSLANEEHGGFADASRKRENWIERWKKRRRYSAEHLSGDEQASESRVRRMGRAIMRLVTAPSPERPANNESPSIVEKAKRVGRWAVFLVTGVRAEVWQATVHEPPAQRQQEIRPLVKAEGNLTAALHELDEAAQPHSIPEVMAEEGRPLAKVYEFPAPRHPERQPAAAAASEVSQNDLVPVASQQEAIPYEIGGSMSAAGASALAAGEAMRRISHPERPSLRTGLALPAAVAVAAGLGLGRSHWRREAQVLRRENVRHEQRLQAHETTLRHLQAERPNLREVAARQAYVGAVASLANREAAEIREVAHEVRAESRAASLLSHPARQETADVPVVPAAGQERPHRLDAQESHQRLTTRTPEVTEAVRELSSAEKAEGASSREVTEQELASRIEQLDRDDLPTSSQQAALLASQAASHTTSARGSQAAQHQARQLRQQQHIQTVAYVILVIAAMGMLLAVILWL